MGDKIVVPANAGNFDLLTAAFRYLVVIFGAVPTLMALLGSRDFAGLVAYFQGETGKTVVAAALALFTLGWGLYKTRKRGKQLVVAADAAPSNVAIVSPPVGSKIG